MGKYTDLHSDVYSVFGAPAWVAEGLKTIPDNYLATALGSEYLRVSVVNSSNLTYANLKNSLAGQLIIDIFVKAGDGLNRTAIIADKLDTYLVRKTISTALGHGTQFGISSMVSLGVDSKNASLYRSSYSIPFNYFGN